MFYIYKTVNKVNGKYYIGKHKGIIGDSYLGSGTVLRQAIEKYGKDSFIKEELIYCLTEEEANYWEKRIVDLNINNPNCYNIAPGGQGGYTTRHFTEEQKELIKKKASAGLKKYRRENPEEVERWQKLQKQTLLKNIDKHSETIKKSLASRSKKEVTEQHRKITEAKLKKGYYSEFSLVDIKGNIVMKSIGAETIAKKYGVSANGIRSAAVHRKPIKRGNLAGYTVVKQVLSEHKA